MLVDTVSMNEKVRNKQFPSPSIRLNPLGGFRSKSGPPGVTRLGPIIIHQPQSGAGISLPLLVSRIVFVLDLSSTSDNDTVFTLRA